MNFVSRRAALRALLAAPIAVLARPSFAQAAYPNRPIRLVVPYPPAALTDLLARAIAERLSSGLGQPVVVENKPGAGTLVGAEFVAKSPPDGYTLLMATSTTLGISPALYPKSPIDPVRDFAPIAQVGSVNFFLIAHPSFPARNVREMIDAVKASPGKYNYASVGSGSPHHLFMETLKTEFGLTLQHVPYKGTPAAVTDLLTNAIQLMFCDATIALPNIQAGKVVALGTSAAKATELVPNVAPVARTVPGFDWQAWQGVVGPAGIPKEVIARLSSEFAKLQQDAEFRAQLVKFGMEPFAPQSPAQFAAVIRDEQPRWAKAVRESGAKVD
ncbi:MAG TPA: tripartite tricarboxylate transporter substrate binding protein [Casimicrobiaceae bacterium]|nr:tripartite tricarboxylate transporter substrate binding protein [Casimicrobiaceae bacterium]